MSVRRTSSKSWLLASAMGALALSWGTAASAQAQGDDGAMLGEIIVTAERREANVQDVPSAVSALDARRIEEAGVTGFSDLALITPGVSFVAATPANNFLRIRGSNPGLVAPGTDQAVTLLVDDALVVGTIGLTQELFDLDRIEVLRGPQGTLFGRNATGGAVLLYTKKPAFEEDARVQVSLGSYGRMNLSGWVTGPLIEDKLAGILSIDARNYDGNYENAITGGRDTRLDQTNVRGSLLWTPSEDLSIQLTGYYTRERNGGPEQFIVGANHLGGAFQHSLLDDAIERGGEVLAIGYQGKHDFDSAAFNLRADWETPLGVLTSITAFRDQSSFEDRESSGSPRAVFPTVTENSDRLFTQEVRLASTSEGPLEWVAGAFYLNQDSSLASTTFTNLLAGSSLETTVVAGQKLYRPDGSGGPLAYLIRSSQATETRSFALFAEATWRFNEQLGLVLGGRQTWDTKSGDTFKDPGSGIINNPASPLYRGPLTVSYERDWDAFTPRVSLTYEPAEHVLMFATYSKGFRSGGFSLEGTTAVEAGVPLAPEYAENYELGLKSRWLGQRLQVNVSAYHLTYEGLQGRGWNNDLLVYTSGNIGDAEVKGLDLELLGQLTPWARLGLNYAYVDGKITKYTNPIPAENVLTTVRESVNSLGKRLTNVPEHTLTLYGALDFDIGDRGELALNADVTFASKMYFQLNNSDPAYLHDRSENKGVLNAQLRYTSPSKRWEAALFARNLTDERYVISGSAELTTLLLTTPEAFTGSGVFGAFYNAPRTFGVNLVWNLN